MNRTLLDVITWGTIGTAVVCALLLAAALDDLESSARSSSGRALAPSSTPPVSPVEPAQRESGRAQTHTAPSPVHLADRS